MSKKTLSPPYKRARKKREDAAATTSSLEQSLVRIKPSVTKRDEELRVACEFDVEMPQIKFSFCGVVSWEC